MKRHDTKNEAELTRLRSQLNMESSDGLKLLADVSDNPICCVSFDASIPCITVSWQRYATSTQFRFVHEQTLHLLAKHGVSKILGDDTALPTIHSDDQAWVVNDWMPRAAAAGLKVAASKCSAAYFGKQAVESVRSEAPGCLTIKVFDTLDAARQWLRDRE